MGTFRCAAYFEQFCRPLSISADCTSLADIQEAFFSKFPELKRTERILIQVHDAELNEFMDFDQDTLVAAGSKLRAVRLPAEVDTDATQRLYALDVEVVEEVQCIQEGACSSLDPRNYALPPTPVDITHNLGKAKKRSDVGIALRRRITEWLCHDLFRYTLYPGKLYRQVVRHLVQRHPVLRDTVGSSHDSWYHRLRYKCKFERTKLLEKEEVADKRKKFGKKRQQTVLPSGDLEAAPAKRVCRKQVGDTTAEDVHSLEGHIKAMKQEMKKTVPNQERVRDSMARTFESRRQYIAEERPLLRDLFERYPALASKEEIFREFERLGGHSPVEAITHVAHTNMNALLDLAGNRVEARTHEILDKARESSTEDQEVLTTLAFLTTLPRAAKEKSSTLLKEKAPWFSKHPLVVWNGDLEGPIDACIVHVEDQMIASSHPVEAILLAFCLHWVVDLIYQPTLKNFYSTIEHLLGLAATKETPTVLTVLSALKP